MFLLVCICTLFVAPDTPAVGGVEGKKAFDDLGVYYSDKSIVPPYQAQIKKLNSADESTSQSAGRYLHALLAQAFADETNSRAIWESQPFWGGGAKSVARDFRAKLAQSLGDEAKSATAIPAVRWLLDFEKSPENQEQAVRILVRIQEQESTDILLEILEKPHPNYVICHQALQELIKRKPKKMDDLLPKFARHYRTDIQATAVKALKESKAVIPEYSFENAYAPQIEATAEEFGKVLKPVPDNAKFVKLVYKTGARYGDSKGNWIEQKQEAFGWQYDKDGKKEFLGWFGTTIAFEAIVEQEDSSLKMAVEHLLAVRAKGEGDQLSRDGGLTAQFEPRFLSSPEIRVFTWCFQRDRKTEMKKLIFPRLNQMRDVRWLMWSSRDILGHPIHQQMLQVFSFSRDYDQALELAESLSRPLFEEYKYRDRAIELAEQLRQRKDVDFKTLTLPNKKKWAGLQATLTRPEQIKFLGDRLRLLNCFQWGQPGGVSYSDEQTAKPSIQKKENESVINPFNELNDMKLSVAELPSLVPYLADEHFMPTFSYWRDFHPGRTFHRVNWAVAYIVDDVAKAELSDIRDYQRKGKAEKAIHIQNILKWCETNKNLSRKELVLKTIRTTKNFREFSTNVSEATAEEYPELLDELKAGWVRFSARSERQQMMEMIYRMNNPEAVSFAKLKLSNQNDAISFWAALVLIAHAEKSDKEEAIAKLEAFLGEKADGSYWYPRAVLPLLKSDSEKAKKLASGILDKDRFDLGFSGLPIVHHLLLAGRQEALDFLVKGLLDEGPSRYVDSIKGDVFLKEINRLAETPFDFDSEWPAEKKKQAREKVAKWLRKQFAAISAGEKHTVKKTPGTIHHSEWQIDAPR